MNNSKYYINKLELIKHPEGGWYKEVYRSDEIISENAIHKRFSSERNISTSIYFLLDKGEFSAFHKIKSDELWHFHDGSSLNIFMISPGGELTINKLGLDIENNESPQIVVPHGYYFAAKSNGEFTLSGCTVAPGFEFEDFDMPSRDNLANLFPAHAELISLLTN